jgi:hypothetical protein
MNFVKSIRFNSFLSILNLGFTCTTQVFGSITTLGRTTWRGFHSIRVSRGLREKDSLKSKPITPKAGSRLEELTKKYEGTDQRTWKTLDPAPWQYNGDSYRDEYRDGIESNKWDERHGRTGRMLWRPREKYEQDESRYAFTFRGTKS